MRLKSLYSLITGMNIILVMLVIGFLSMIMISFYGISSMLQENIRSTIICRTAESADVVKREAEAVINKIEGITLRSEIKSMNWDLQKPILRLECARLNLFNIQVIDMQGFSRSVHGTYPDVIRTEYFKKAKNGVSALTDPFQSKYVNKRIVLCTVPIFNNDKHIIGVLAASMDSHSLFDIVDNRRVGTTGFCFIVNRQGNVIANPEYQTINLHINPAQKGDQKYRQLEILTGKLARGEVGHGFFWHEGVEKFMAFAPVYGTNWSLAMTVPKNEIFSEIDALRNRYVIFTVIPLFVTLLFGIILNIYRIQHRKMAKLKEDAETNAKLLKESMELDQLKTDFFAIISHEFRTPLSVILGSLQMLDLSMKKYPTQNIDQWSRYLQTIKQNCLRSIRLSNNLIDTTKIDAGYFEMHFTNCNIVSLVEEITLSVADYIKDKGISIQFDTEIEEKIIACDIDKIERIILNLLSNAVKFTDNGGGIYVSIFDRETSVVISIRDTGIGIPGDKTDQIFERFRQVDQSTTRNNEGSGIGLSLVKSLVNMHHGTISVKSTLGEGSEFFIDLPANAIPEDSDTVKKVLTPDQTHYFEKIKIEFSDIYK